MATRRDAALASDSADAEPNDRLLVSRAVAGDAEAFAELVSRHQRFIYNVAVRMLAHPQDAQDATQEILIKAVTGLSSFEGQSAFRTWLYRIAVNHLLNARRGRRERDRLTFACYAHGLDGTPDMDLPDTRSAPADIRLLAAEARLGCTAGMLLCLDREQRLAYILGEIFGVTDVVGADVMNIGRAAFRQRLARARRDLHSFMKDKCGLVNAANPCRCAKKTRGFIEAGYVDPHRLLFATHRVAAVRERAGAAAGALAAQDARCAGVFRQHPIYESPDLVPAIRQLLADPEFRRAADLP